jgi:hypothetical protein
MKMALLFLVVGMAVSATSPVIGEVIFQDGDFSGWSTEIAKQNGSPSYSVARIATGGNPDAYWRVTQNTTHSGDLIYLFHTDVSNFTYSPSTSGAIDTIDFSLDRKLLAGYGLGQGFGPMIKQDGIFYRANGDNANDTTKWSSFSSLGLTENDFFLISDASQHPDFSITGSVITIGYFSSNSISQQQIAGYDNYSCTVKPVAEPSSLAFYIVLLIIGVAFKLRYWHK